LSGATLCQAFRPAPGEARPDWAIFAELGRRLGFAEQFAWSDAAAVYAEFAALTTGRLCDGTGLSKALLAAHGPQQWPSLSLRHCPRRRSSATLRSMGALPGGRRPAITSPPPAAGRASGPIRPSAWPPPKLGGVPGGAGL